MTDGAAESPVDDAPDRPLGSAAQSAYLVLRSRTSESSGVTSRVERKGGLNAYDLASSRATW